MLLKIKSKLSQSITLHLSEVVFIVSVDIIYTGISRPDYPQLDGWVSVNISRGCFTKNPCKNLWVHHGLCRDGGVLFLTSLWSIWGSWTHKVEQVYELLASLFNLSSIFVDLATVYSISKRGIWRSELVNLVCICLTLYFIYLVIVNMSHAATALSWNTPSLSDCSALLLLPCWGFIHRISSNKWNDVLFEYCNSESLLVTILFGTKPFVTWCGHWHIAIYCQMKSYQFHVIIRQRDPRLCEYSGRRV